MAASTGRDSGCDLVSAGSVPERMTRRYCPRGPHLPRVFALGGADCGGHARRDEPRNGGLQVALLDYGEYGYGTFTPYQNFTLP